jgi:D-alanine-D-alanine ligase
MHIGLTYDLRSEYLAAGLSEVETAEFDRESTVEAIEAALQQLGHQTDRIGHARQLIHRLDQGDRWDLVFNIAEGMSGIAREAQVPRSSMFTAFLTTIPIHWCSPSRCTRG